ncbi:family 43 glycosylhydrolase [Streptomyces glycanivorans]|uniref:Family 43 glycosylhydrolase n=1 Tax=Streptomyces glycanivorans TaxID=3033808 RepID=A0ABY9J7Q4_9ACTN|nr:family 43 glycosylhydrolase [Streptomyces sp. Alt3]WLQ63645.1 family 43 glycosylhydrolase [Streptomyces sp. Alt3]
MYPISRRSLLRGAAGALPLLGAGPAFAATASDDVPPPHRVGAGPFTHVYDPSTSTGPRYLNDHTLINARGRWHLFAIVGDSAPPGGSPDSAAETSFAHASAPGPHGPWTGHPDALVVDPSYFGEEHLWAPHVVEADGRFWMFYAAGGASGAAINLATSTDLFTWTREPSGPLFRGIVARDPMVLRVGGEWVMYYTELSGPGGHHVVACRRSADLRNWGDPRVVFTDASTDATVSVTESPYVVERDGWYYLFIGPRNGYEGTDVLASRDPFGFGLAGSVGHVPGHAVEVVRDGETWYASAAGWFRNGLYMAPLSWRDTPTPWQSPDNPVAGLDVAAGSRCSHSTPPTTRCCDASSSTRTRTAGRTGRPSEGRPVRFPPSDATPTAGWRCSRSLPAAPTCTTGCSVRTAAGTTGRSSAVPPVPPRPSPSTPWAGSRSSP